MTEDRRTVLLSDEASNPHKLGRFLIVMFLRSRLYFWLLNSIIFYC